jgi:hypothetical protein
LQGFHGFGQGEVVNAVLVRRTADLGMVDEDPLQSHHRGRDAPARVQTTTSLELRRRGDRHLVIVKPDLERCFLRSMGLVKLDSELPTRPEELRALLNLPKHPKHQTFTAELAELHAASRAQNISTFITELEAFLEPLTS